MKIGGALKDTRDKNDFNARELLAGISPVAIPDEFDFAPDPYIFDQGQTLKCVAEAETGARIDWYTSKDVRVPDFDDDALYATIKVPGGGAYPRDGLHKMNHDGMPVRGISEKCWLKRKLFGATAWLPEHKLEGYYRIDKNMSDDEIKSIIMTYGTIVIACAWDKNWTSRFKVFPDPGGFNEGGHCTRVTGWNKSGWKVVNSWGELSWGVNGIAFMPSGIFRKYVLSEGDCWKLVDDKLPS